MTRRTRTGWAVTLVWGAIALGWWATTPAQPGGEQTRPMVRDTKAWRTLTPAEERVIVGKGTERPFTGRYVDVSADGTYTCKRCGATLFSSEDKFDSGCGWPSFDDALPGAVREVTDADGVRTEIVCAACGAHLGHVFRGEGMTARDTRHCVNSISLSFESAAEANARPEAGDADDAPSETAEAFFAGGCFWGVEHLMARQPGVLDVRSGYMGGHVDAPSYEQVSTGRTGHAETVRVVYDPRRVRYQELAKLFFEIHDPTQGDRQGPDRGTQYRSAVFYTDEGQRRDIVGLVARLRARGLRVTTEIEPAPAFWPAEDYHQDYYAKTGKQPYCHTRVRRFGD